MDSLMNAVLSHIGAPGALPHADRPMSAAGAVSDGAPAEGQTPLARSTDPITSHEAADDAATFAEQHRVRVLAALMKAGGRCGSEHMAFLCGLAPYQVRKRTVELERAGLIRRTGNLCLTRSGRREQEWEVVA